jgi:hypothetical protein
VSIKVLAEAIILQSIEDLWSTDHRRESASFLGGEGFRIAAEIAGLESNERRRIFDLVKEIFTRENVVCSQKAIAGSWK